MSTHHSDEHSYVLGTHDAEIARLGVQHRVWRPSVLELWRQAGITQNQTVIDAGAGPGHATLDLAEIVGPQGRVIALERSRRFLDALAVNSRARGLANIETHEADLLDYPWPEEVADRIWCRWVLAFLPDPAKALRGMARALKPGGKLLLHEYFDYACWRLAPHSAPFEAYVAKIIARWRASGGDPDIGLALPQLLPDAGFRIESARPVVFAARMSDFASRWPMGFAREHLAMMRDAGDAGAEECAEITAVLDRYEADSEALVITPGVLQIVASKQPDPPVP